LCKPTRRPQRRRAQQPLLNTIGQVAGATEELATPRVQNQHGSRPTPVERVVGHVDRTIQRVIAPTFHPPPCPFAPRVLSAGLASGRAGTNKDVEPQDKVPVSPFPQEVPAESTLSHAQGEGTHLGTSNIKPVAQATRGGPVDRELEQGLCSLHEYGHLIASGGPACLLLWPRQLSRCWSRTQAPPSAPKPLAGLSPDSSRSAETR